MFDVTSHMDGRGFLVLQMLGIGGYNGGFVDLIMRLGGSDS